MQNPGGLGRERGEIVPAVNMRAKGRKTIVRSWYLQASRRTGIWARPNEVRKERCRYKQIDKKSLTFTAHKIPVE